MEIPSRSARSLAQRVIATALPNQNSRMMFPPGKPGAHGRANIVVATPMRSGTHLLIDLLLNNLVDYRTRPLYVNLDKCLFESTPQRNLLSEVSSDAGHVLKTHMPAAGAPQGTGDPEVLRILDSAIILNVRRPREDVVRSLKRWGWGSSPDFYTEFAREWDTFWAFWEGRATMTLEFADLLDPDRAHAALQRVAQLTGTSVRRQVRMPLPASKRRRIYVNKGLTRVAGRLAPRIDTTIETLKR